MNDYSLPFITWQVVDRTLHLLDECQRQGMAKPRVYPNHNGGVQVKWCTDSGHLIEVDLVNGGAVTFIEEGAEPCDMGRFDSINILGKVNKACADEAQHV
jgi:hypothetical protein